MPPCQCDTHHKVCTILPAIISHIVKNSIQYFAKSVNFLRFLIHFLDFKAKKFYIHIQIWRFKPLNRITVYRHTRLLIILEEFIWKENVLAAALDLFS